MIIADVAKILPTVDIKAATNVTELNLPLFESIAMKGKLNYRNSTKANQF